MIYIKKLKDLKKLKNFNLINFAVPIIDHLRPIKYSPNGKYDNKYFLICILDFIEKNVSWKKYKGTIEYPINGLYLNQIHNEYCKLGVYDEIERQLKNKYLNTDRESKLKFQIIDSSFVSNKQGMLKKNNYLLTNEETEKNNKIKKENLELPQNKQKKLNNFIDFNRYNGRKKYFNVSVITDSYGVPLEKSISSSKEHDSKTLIRNVNNLPNELNTLRNSKINRYKQYFLGNAGYDTKKNKQFLIDKGYKPIIRYNRKNTKDKNIIANNELIGVNKLIYKNRQMVESFFAWIKNYPVINQNYQKTITSYNGLFSLACSLIISKRI
jgi:transposase